MIKTVHFITIICLIISNLNAQNTGLKVRIVASDKVTPVIFALVKNTEADEFAITNELGELILDEFSCQVCSLEISCLGYVTKGLVIDRSSVKTPGLIILEEDVLNLGTVVIEGRSLTRGHLDAWKIPGSSHFISPEQLRAQNYTDPGRLLQTIPGVNVQEEDGYGLRPNIGLRGSGSDRSSKITLMEDGILIAPAPYAEPAAYYFPFFGRMQGLEILKGSSQIKYGPFTTAGALNLLSTAIPQEFGGKISLRGSSYGGREVHAYAGTKTGIFSVLAETFQMASDGFKELDQGGPAGFNLQDYVIKARLETADKTKPGYQLLEFKWQQSRELAHETYLGLTESDFASTPYRRYLASEKDNIQTRHRTWSATHFIRLAPWAEITTLAYRNDFSRNWYKLDAVSAAGNKISIGSGLLEDNPQHPFYLAITGQATDAHTLWVKANNRRYFSQGVQTTLSLNLGEKPGHKHHLDMGLRYHQDEADRFQWTDGYTATTQNLILELRGQPGSESNRINQASAWSGFVQHLWEKGRWTFTPGVRYEHIQMQRVDYGKTDPERLGTALQKTSNTVGVIIPGMGASYQIDPGWVGFTGVHRGFSPPGVNEGSLPELSLNMEAGIRYFKNRLGWKAVLFADRYNNLLGKDLTAAGGVGTGDTFNGGDATAHGLELEGKYYLNLIPARQIIVPLNLSYSYTVTRFKHDFASEFEAWGAVKTGDWLPYLAPHRLLSQIGLESPQWSTELSINYQTAMRSKAGQGPIPSAAVIPARTILDFSIHYQLSPQVSFFSQINNVLNTAYLAARHPSGLRPGLPRLIRFGVEFDF